MFSQQQIIDTVYPYLSDIGVGLVFGLGYYHISYLFGDKKQDKKLLQTKSNINLENCKTLDDFNQIIKINEENPKLDSFEMIQIMNERQISPDINTYNNLLNACYIQENFEVAEKITEELFDFVSPVQPDLTTFNILLKGISIKLDSVIHQNKNEKESYIKSMDKLLSQLKSLGVTKENVKPNNVTINTCIDILIKAEDTDRAWDLFENMETLYGLPTDKYSYSTIIKSLKFDPSQEKLNKAFGIIDLIRENKFNNRVNDEIIFNCLIDACVRLNLTSKAEELFKEMKSLNIEPTKITYAVMIKTYGNSFELDKAFQLFEEMKISNLPPNEIVYGCLLNACVRCSNINKVTEIYKEMKKFNLELNIILYTILIKAYTKVKDINSALDVYYTMLSDKKVKPNIVIHNAMLDCCVECKSIEKLNQIYDFIKEKASSGEDPNAPQPDLITYSTVIKAYSRVKDMEKVFDIYNFLKENSSQFKLDEIVFNSILDGCAKTNNYKKGLEIYEDMQKLNIPKSNVTYSILVKMYANAGEAKKAMAVLEDMIKDRIKPGMIVYTCLIQVSFKSGDYNQAFSLFEEMKKSNKADHVLYNTVVNGSLFHQKWMHAYKYTIESLENNIKMATDLYNTVIYKLTGHFCNLSPQEKIDCCTRIIKEVKERGIDITPDNQSRIAKLIYNYNGNSYGVSETNKTSNFQNFGKMNPNYNNKKSYGSESIYNNRKQEDGYSNSNYKNNYKKNNY